MQSGDIGGLLALPKEIAAAVGDVLAGFSMGTVAPRVEKIIAPVQSLVEAFVGKIKSILEPFQKLTDLAVHFVQEIDPSLVMNLSQRFRDLNATIGVALRPIVDVARDVVKALADYLLPAMKKLEPIVREISEVVGSALVDGFNELADTLDTMMPLFKELKEFIVGAIPILGDLRQLLAAIRLPLMQLVHDLLNAITGGEGGGGVKGAMQALRKAVQDVIVTLVQFMAHMFQMIGWAKGLEALRKSLTAVRAERADSTGVATALNPMFKAIGEMGKSIEAAMFAASDVPGGKLKGVDRSNELLEEVAKGIDRGALGQDAITDFLKGPATDFFNRIWVKVDVGVNDLINAIERRANKVMDDAKGFAAGAAANAAGKVADVANKAGDLVGGENNPGFLIGRHIGRKLAGG